MDRFYKNIFRRTSDDDGKPSPPEPPEPPQLWRKPLNEDLPTLKKKLENYTPPPSLKISQARILLIGPIGAGKSSFCNTVSTIFSGVINHPCPCGTTVHSLTTKYRQYHVRSNETKSDLKFCLCDTCGIEPVEGLHLDDIEYLLDGSVPEEYEFNTNMPINRNTNGFKKAPALEDQVHCVAFVIAGNTVEGLEDALWEKLKKIHKEISRRGMPSVILLTKLDKLLKDGNISNVFESCPVVNAVKALSAMLGIPRHKVHPIKNYEEEMELNDDISRLALTALDQMTTFASEFLEQKRSSLSRIKPWRQPSPELNTENMLTLKEKIEKYAPQSDLGIPFARILMIGPVESGKSSFINTLYSVYSGRMTQHVIDGPRTMYQQYQIQSHETGQALNFLLCDMCGIEYIHNTYLTDLMYVIEGHIPDHYKLSSDQPITPSIPGFKRHPGLKDKVHCIVFSFDASTIDNIDKPMWDKLRELQVRLNSIDLPRAVLLTKIDKISQTLHDDLSTIFANADVHGAVQKVVHGLRVPANKIHPIKNYEEETLLNDKTSTLSLLALDQILGFADDFLSRQRKTNEKQSNSLYVLFSGLVLVVALVVMISKVFSI